MLNVDYKIFAKILSDRLLKLVDDLIGKDQTGFIPGRYMKQNIHHVLNLMDFVKKRKANAAFIFLDAEKAFDNVSWLFLKEVIKKFNLGSRFSLWINQIYANQNARILVNGMVISEAVKVQKVVLCHLCYST